MMAAKPELTKARGARYRQNKPAESIYRHLVKRALEQSAAVMSREEWCEWYYAQPQICVYCGIDAEAAKAEYGHALHIDRKQPNLGYSSGNVALACHRCNVVKSKYLTHVQMMQVAGRYFGGPHGNAHDELVAATEDMLLWDARKQAGGHGYDSIDLHLNRAKQRVREALALAHGRA